MRVWGSKHGKLPAFQIAVMVIVAAILQIFWMVPLLLAILLSPFLRRGFSFYHKYMAGLPSRIWTLSFLVHFLGAVCVIAAGVGSGAVIQ